MVPTCEHWRIEKWAEENGATPAQIRRLKYDGEPAILTFVFGSGADTQPEVTPITWDAFFAQFDLLTLSMVFDDESTSFRIVNAEKLSAAYPAN